MTGPTPAPKIWLHGLLFVLTCLTVCYAGLSWSANFIAAGSPAGSELLVSPDRVFRDARLFQLSALYAACLMTVLVGHELGHFLTCVRYRIPCTLPYFMPGPPFLGTFGAFIRMAPPPLRRQVFDVGAHGPLVGFALTLPTLAAGLALSKVAPFTASEGTLYFGEPLLFKLLGRLFLGPIPAGSDVVLHPIGWAGWVGLLLTALNLLPIGQLDGGHVAYALLGGRRAQRLSWAMVGIMAVLGVLFHVTWLLLAVVILVMDARQKARLKHPPVLDEGAPLGPRRTLLAVLILAIFALSFVPDPVHGVGLLDIVRGRAGAF